MLQDMKALLESSTKVSDMRQALKDEVYFETATQIPNAQMPTVRISAFQSKLARCSCCPCDYKSPTCSEPT